MKDISWRLLLVLIRGNVVIRTDGNTKNLYTFCLFLLLIIGPKPTFPHNNNSNYRYAVPDIDYTIGEQDFPSGWVLQSMLKISNHVYPNHNDGGDAKHFWYNSITKGHVSSQSVTESISSSIRVKRIAVWWVGGQVQAYSHRL